jgi:hypothetical protein
MKTTMRPNETFRAARDRLLRELSSHGWAVSGPLKVPHATDPDRRVRFYFTAQAVHVSLGPTFTANDARSLWVDTRGMSVEQLLDALNRWLAAG